jgi:hypothetical protein
MANAPAARAMAIIVGVIVIAAVTVAAAYDQVGRQFGFRTQTELVRITATVSDATGKAITDLHKEDFTVSEDNVAQEIALFSLDIDTPRRSCSCSTSAEA